MTGEQIENGVGTTSRSTNGSEDNTCTNGQLGERKESINEEVIKESLAVNGFSTTTDHQNNGTRVKQNSDEESGKRSSDGEEDQLLAEEENIKTDESDNQGDNIESFFISEESNVDTRIFVVRKRKAELKKKKLKKLENLELKLFTNPKLFVQYKKIFRRPDYKILYANRSPKKTTDAILLFDQLEERSKVPCLTQITDLVPLIYQSLNFLHMRWSFSPQVLSNFKNSLPNQNLVKNRMKAFYYQKLHPLISSKYILSIRIHGESHEWKERASRLHTLIVEHCRFPETWQVGIHEYTTSGSDNFLNLYGCTYDDNGPTGVLESWQIFQYIEEKRHEIKEKDYRWNMCQPLRYMFNSSYLGNAPAGFSQQEWKEAHKTIPEWSSVSGNPQSYKFYKPVPILGVKGMAETKLELINRLAKINENIQAFKVKIRNIIKTKTEVLQRVERAETKYREHYFQLTIIVLFFWTKKKAGTPYFDNLSHSMREAVMAFQRALKEIDPQKYMNVISHSISPFLLEERTVFEEWNRENGLQVDFGTSQRGALKEVLNEKLQSLNQFLGMLQKLRIKHPE